MPFPRAVVKKVNQEYLMRSGLIAAAVLGILGTGFFSVKYFTLRANPNREAQREVQALVEAIGKIMELPEGETPTVATVVDPEVLKGQAFFASSARGDKLLAYTAARLAILYRPDEHKIITVAPITIDAPSDIPVTRAAESAASTQTVPMPRIAYYNGTDTNGVAKTMEERVRAAFPSFTTALLANTQKKDYAGIMVVAISSRYTKEAEAIAGKIGGSVGVLPEGESAPDADILILVGAK
jgi:hypothetical protein